ncbi:uncharacterized protein J3R85_000150 [Psidium guajava]|nr:uncharacterized protein J3R85_000150 [Psidium guajava]
MDGSKHHLPLTTVGPLNEQKILPVGDRINAVGLFFLKNGIAQIKSCNDLPYFLTKMTKDQMVIDLALRTKILFWSSILLGSASICILDLLL